MISLIIPVYNQEELILNALDSIPIRDDLEVIVVDDCSTDNTFNVVKSYSRLNIKIVRLDVNSGNCTAKNRGIEEASGEWIYFLDSDDYLILPEFDEFLDSLDSKYDLVYLSNEVNNGDTWTDMTRVAPWCYAIRKEFLDKYNLRYENGRRRAGDWFLMKEINKHNPKKFNTFIVAYHYNYPRVGSIVWNWDHYRRV